MISSQIRTDLALEARESIQKNKTPHSDEIHGVQVCENYEAESGTTVTTVCITTKNAAKAIGKPMGTYITIEAPEMSLQSDDYHREISIELSKQLKKLLPSLETEKSILVIGLGNREVTADALGPNVIDNLLITRHIIREYGKAAYKNAEPLHLVSSLSPGVMAQNGMETAEIVKGVIRETSPDIMLVIDALAARSTKRLNSTIQLTDTGIQPGSGVGNHRSELSMASLGIPVIAIGVPTVVDGGTIVRSALDAMRIEPAILDFDSPKVQTVLAQLNNMFVTNKDIDATIKRLSYTISEALNMTFSC